MSNETLVSFENTYMQGPAEIGTDVRNNGALGCITIDGFPADEDKEGTVVCRIWMTDSGNFIIDWHDNGYRMNKQVLELIEDSIKILEEANPRQDTNFSLSVFPEIEFDDGTAVICKYHGQHTMEPRPGDIQTIVDAVAKSYEAGGLKVLSAKPVSESAYELFDARFNSEHNPDTDKHTTVVTWNGAHTEINKEMLVSNDPTEESQFCTAIIKACEQLEKPVPVTTQAAMDLYASTKDIPLFLSLFNQMMGKEKAFLHQLRTSLPGNILARADRNMEANT